MDVETCRFFPSGIVVLSGGSDMRLKIWSAQDGTCPRTLIGHTGGQGAQYWPGGRMNFNISPQASLTLLLLTEERI